MTANPHMNWSRPATCSTSGQIRHGAPPQAHDAIEDVATSQMRVPQDPREVWVVYDRLWRSRNWLGPLDHSANTDLLQRKRKRDCRFWENDEEAINGEPVGVKGEGKALPTHERQSHKRFTDDVKCSACDEPILERCEQCSVMMHCSGCRKTLCASCAFDRPYLRNKNAPEAERKKFGGL